MERKTRKQRINVDLPVDQVKWLEKTVLKVSLERGEKVSRNQLISEAVEILRKQFEKTREEGEG